jgi:hypothetical protein
LGYLIDRLVVKYFDKKRNRMIAYINLSQNDNVEELIKNYSGKPGIMGTQNLRL